MVDEEKQENKETKTEGTESDSGDGNKSETAKETDQLNIETQELEKAIAEKKNADARSQIAGVTSGKIAEPEKKEETAREYSDRIMKGELTPEEQSKL